MSSWNYRLILHDTDTDSDSHWIGLHEVYYEKDKETVSGWTVDAVPFIADAEEGEAGIIKSLSMALTNCLKHPMLIESELEAKCLYRKKQREKRTIRYWFDQFIKFSFDGWEKIF